MAVRVCIGQISPRPAGLVDSATTWMPHYSTRLHPTITSVLTSSLYPSFLFTSLSILPPRYFFIHKHVHRNCRNYRKYDSDSLLIPLFPADCLLSKLSPLSSRSTPPLPAAGEPLSPSPTLPAFLMTAIWATASPSMVCYQSRNCDDANTDYCQ